MNNSRKFQFYRAFKNWQIYLMIVPSKNLSGEARAEYFLIKNLQGKVVKVYKDTFRIDGRFLHRSIKYPSMQGKPKYSY